VVEGKTLDGSRKVYIDAYWVPAKYRGARCGAQLHLWRRAIGCASPMKRAEQTQQIARNFEATIGRPREIGWPRTAAEMRSTSHGMSMTAKDTTTQATRVLAAVEQASGNVQIVAASTKNCPHRSPK